MSSIEYNVERDMEIDIYHALSDFLDAYDNHAEMVITEAIANAIDVDATEIKIELKEDLDSGYKTVSFYNNGPPMNRKQFENYHVIARSSKSKGEGIGFAGIGAKVYLAAWENAIIHTETTDGTAAFASDMYVKDSKLKSVFVKPKIRTPGTIYSVRLSYEDHAYMEKNMSDVIINVFTPAMLNGLKIRLDGRQLQPWKPPHEFRKSFTIKNKRRRAFPTIVTVTKDDIQESKLYVQYHVSGKVITTKKPEWGMEIKPAYRKRVHAYVDATRISNLLNLDKTKFKAGAHTAMADINPKIYDVLKKAGYTDEDDMRKWERNNLTKFFERIFKDPKYSFLNPGIRGGTGTVGQGDGKSGDESEESEQEHTAEREQKDRKVGVETPERKKAGSGGGSFTMGYVARGNDPREGWLDTLSNKAVINMDHPLFIKYEKNPSARNQRVATILTAMLIKNAASKKDMSPVEAFDLQTELMTMAKDEMW